MRLESLLERDRSLTDPDDATRADTNTEFHEAVWAATHNPVLQDLLRRLTVHLVRTPHSTLSARRPLGARPSDEHEAMVAAIRDRDDGAARGRRDGPHDEGAGDPAPAPPRTRLQPPSGR